MKKILKGLIIGISYVIPGVSGSAIAVILNEYDNLLKIIGNVWNVKSVIKQYQLIIGIGLGIVLSLGIFDYLFQLIPLQLMSFFIGMILVGGFDYATNLPSRIFSVKGFIWSTLGASLILGLSIVLSTKSHQSVNYLFLFMSFFISAMAMMLPGVSGSLLLMVFGVYFLTLNNFTILCELLLDDFTLDKSLTIYFVVTFVAFILGAIIACLFILKWKNKYPFTFNCLSLGLIFGSLFVLISDLLYQITKFSLAIECCLVIVLGILSMLFILSILNRIKD